ncbi:MAG: hypothetical protein ACXW15_01300 [Acidimicrobiia bacterium]
MNSQERLSAALRRADEFAPSPDLFARVQSSIEEDAAHRRRLRRLTLGLVPAMAVAVGWIFLFGSVNGAGTLVAPGWAVALWQLVILLSVTIVMGPAIRRFGKGYAADVFRIDSNTGPRIIRLLDIAYYLVFAGIVLLAVAGDSLAGAGESIPLIPAIESATGRIAILVLVMGGLHSGTITVLPLIGLIFSSTVRRSRRLQAGESAPPADPDAEAAERMVRLIIWVIVALLGAGIFTGAVLAVGIGIGSS